MDRWFGRTAVVTGASSGIGAAVAVALADHGLTVIGLARREHLVHELNAKVTGKGQIYARQCDIGNTEDVASAFQWIDENHDGTDILVNNAGIFIPGRITDAGDMTISEASLLSILDVNFKGLVLCSRHAVASMKKRSFDGHIVNVSSLAGQYIPFCSYFNVYSSTKHAVSAFSSALLNELADTKSRIKLTVVLIEYFGLRKAGPVNFSPGLVRTAITLERPEDEPMLEPTEVADAILYVISTPPNVNAEEEEEKTEEEERLTTDDANCSSARRTSSFSVHRGDAPGDGALWRGPE